MSILWSSILLVCVIGAWTRDLWFPCIKESRAAHCLVERLGYVHVVVSKLVWDTVSDRALCVYVGRRKSGKTTNIASTLVQKYGKFKTGLIFTGAKASSIIYESVTPQSTSIYHGFHPEILRGFLKKRVNGAAMDCLEPVFVVIDDCLPRDTSSIPCIRELFTNHGHLKIFLLVAVQSARLISPCLRTQTDHVFISREIGPRQQADLFHFFVDGHPYDLFERCLGRATQNNGALVLSTTTSRTWMSRYRAPFLVLARG